MGEQRFKVGDWVRVKDNCGAPLDYKIGDICQVSAVRKDLVYCGDAAMFAKRFEPWQPRVGERVKVNYGHGWNGEGEVSRYVGESVVVLMETGNFSGRVGGFNVSHLEPITTATTPEQPATLKIEAGKFYKTRDGRKVGPMFGDEYGLWTAPGFNLKEWYGNGRRYTDLRRTTAADLIAEWIDEPVAKASNDNAKPKFKVGDIVTPSHGWSKDNATVTQIKDGRVSVRWNNGAFGSENGWREDELSPVLPRPTTTIVALIENGQPKPSSTPHIHASTDSAEKEAKRLAAKYKGKQFGVFTLTTTHEEAAPVYDHKWQNMAALGLKIDAIKELRAVAGLDLLSAKRAVEAFEHAA